jgi:hypothetical protein
MVREPGIAFSSRAVSEDEVVLPFCRPYQEVIWPQMNADKRS